LSTWNPRSLTRGSYGLITRSEFMTPFHGQNVNKSMIRIESFYATNQPWRVNPTTPDLLPSIYPPIEELSYEKSTKLKTLRLQSLSTADQRPRPPPTPLIEAADHRSAAASWNCRCRGRWADQTILINV